MDGTLIDSQLDFDQMRLDLNLPKNAPILETIESYTGTRRQQCNQVLRQHEQIGVEKATVFPGISEFVEYADSLGLKMAIVTRNLHEFAPSQTLVIHRISLPVSAMKIYTFLKKSRPKRFITKKVRAFWNRPTKK